MFLEYLAEQGTYLGWSIWILYWLTGKAYPTREKGWSLFLHCVFPIFIWLCVLNTVITDSPFWLLVLIWLMTWGAYVWIRVLLLSILGAFAVIVEITKRIFSN